MLATLPLFQSIALSLRGISSHPERLRLRSHARGAMLGLALGDALGATVEFMTPREIRSQYGRHDRIRGGGWLRLAPGQVTDDTTMAFALAEAWLTHHHAPSAEDYARAFDAWMRAKPVDIGHTVRRGIARFRNTGLACTPYSEDAGNGATMRCAPTAIALLGAPADTVGRATLAQARVTHHNILTDAATLAVVNMVQAGIVGKAGGGGLRAVMAQANLLVREFPLFQFRTKPAENPSGYIVDSMRVVLRGIAFNDNFESALVHVVNCGGDADTTGAIAGMVMGALVGEAGLPERWLRELESSTLRRCNDYADALIERSPAWQAC
ncbi:ADP-ribosylglycohydrolase family protein [Uliginosibacterium aquaticum]|uniref:ADP-ribosylglycohydrolase family protein n=1 Tax=Uliginosibacterium aquaticum TaxID=2731212 RepID=A0ABX2IJD8_9RHOO|nr:ADP-ribosylglycohydrolase family protein [Uliginosibacterium aquaticum]NSL54744.1 ADP-ribosylglycohydrolase family protein [Uliginosibacterium aquaticum]